MDEASVPASDEPGESEGIDRPVDRFRRTAVGGVVAAGLFGLRDALEGRPEREEITIVSEAPGQDVSPSVDVQLDPEHPERSVVVVRSDEPTNHDRGSGRTAP